ncbi:MAG: hypothetical protein GY711_02920 [bacterium]|nr:hypothetical protein [bacterium]
MKIALATFALLALTADLATAQLTLYDAGIAGNPPQAPDPTTQGFALRSGGGNVGLIPISPDGATGLNAWEVSDSDTSPIGYAYYQDYPAPPTGSLLTFIGGTWELTATLRMTAGPTPTVFIELGSGPTFLDTTYRLELSIAGNDVVASTRTGQSFLCPNGVDGYHTYSIRKTSDVFYGNAEVLYDGQVLGTIPEFWYPHGSNYGVLFGAHPNGTVGRARFHRVEVRSLDDLGTSYCGPQPVNSTGNPAVLTAYGSPYANQNFLELTASDLPQNQFGYFLASLTTGFVANPGGSIGNLCLSGSIGRFVGQIGNSGAAGAISIDVDLNAIPVSPPHAVTAGETWHFQGWFRDVANTSNFTDGVSIEFR